MSLQSEIVKKTIMGVLALAGTGTVLGAGWTAKTVLKHERQFELMTQHMEFMAKSMEKIEGTLDRMDRRIARREGR